MADNQGKEFGVEKGEYPRLPLKVGEEGEDIARKLGMYSGEIMGDDRGEEIGAEGGKELGEVGEVAGVVWWYLSTCTFMLSTSWSVDITYQLCKGTFHCGLLWYTPKFKKAGLLFH